MKNLLSARGILIAVGTLLGILVFVFSFLVSVKSVTAAIGATSTHIDNGVIWGCRSWKDIKTIPGIGTSEVSGVYNDDAKHGALLLPLIGAILALVGGLGAYLVLLLVKDAKLSRICLIVCGALLVIGGVFYFFTVNAYYSEAAKRLKTTVEDLKKAADAFGTKVSSPLATVGGILGILGGLSVCGGALLSKD